MMSEPDLEKLLGGFAADTLTPEEKQALYSAALNDQQLFNALADEQTLKELLADPVVRRRLLASLEQKNPSIAGGSLPWLDWFRRPAGLAFAGGLTAAALAVLLGIRVYQDSLKQAAQSVATEEARPAAAPAPTAPASQPVPPQVTEPQAKAKENTELPITPARKDILTGKMAKRERSVPPQEQRASEIVRDSQKQGNEQDEVLRQSDAPIAALSKTAERLTSSSDQKLAASSAPPIGSAPAPMSAPAIGPFVGAVTPTISARAQFYGGAQSPSGGRMLAQEQEHVMKPLAESTPQANRLERTMDQSAQAGKAAGTATQLKPLGLRYSFVVSGTDGQDREVDAATAAKSPESARLTVETNQAAYLQVWMRTATSTPQLLVPQKESGQISLKIAAGQRQNIPLPTDRKPLTLTARLSRVPFGPITRQEAAMFDRLSPDQLQETISAGRPAGSQEQATYVVNQDPAPSAQISVEIPLGR